MTGADVVVVGGGPAGSATAWRLARTGVDVLLVDRARFPREKACAEYLSPEASRLLAEMGVLEACERAGAAQLAGMVVRAPNGSRIHGDFAAHHGFPAFRDRGLALRRWDLDRILLDRARAAGVRVAEGVRVTGVTRDGGGRVAGVTVLGGGDAIGAGGTGAQRIAARLVVGADGLRSVIARALGVAHRAHWPRRIAVVAHYAGVRDVGAYGEMHVEPDGYAGIADVGRGVTNLAVVVPAARVARTGSGGWSELAGDAGGYLERWMRRRPHLAPRLAGAERIGAARVTGPFAVRARRAWASGAALVGDAADFFDPFTGEGIYAALRGAELLAPALGAALAARTVRDADHALAGYDRARRLAFREKWRVEQLVAFAVAAPMLMNRAATALARRKDMADLLVGVAGDFVPPRAVLAPGFLARLLFS